LEEELNQSWKEKCDRLLTSAQEKHQRALAEVTADKEAADEKLRLLEIKVISLFLFDILSWMLDVDGSSLPVDSQLKSVGFNEGWRPPGTQSTIIK